MKRYPCCGRVSMKLGLSASSRSAARSLLMALFRPRSKSTKVSSGQSFLLSSSRVTTSPGRSRSNSRAWKGCSCRLILEPCRRSSPERVSTSKSPKRMRCAKRETHLILRSEGWLNRSVAFAPLICREAVLCPTYSLDSGILTREQMENMTGTCGPLRPARVNRIVGAA